MTQLGWMVLAAVVALGVVGVACTARRGGAVDAAGPSGSGAGAAAQPADSAEPSVPGVQGDPALDGALRAASAAAGHTPRTDHRAADGTPRFVNRLARESSPYLLQHAHNPVNWHPWGDAAFEKARRLDRPVLLSVGYSTCHWCHVMERESFEDLEIAAFINAHFIPIKVDREQRPDVDAVYMNAVYALAGRGGWPMTVLLTPDRRPFFAGTYFPARTGDRGSRRGLLTILQGFDSEWRTARAGLVARAAEVSRKVAAMGAIGRPGAVPGPEAIERAVRQIAASFDPRDGGWGLAPKFPRPSQPALLLRYHRRTGDPEALRQVVHTLRRMAAGGIHDQVGGGFHRYSVDGRWLVPHFEKMLYDQAQLARLYVEAWQITGADDLAAVARRTLDYVARELVDGQGGFHSATDADSPAPGGHDEEGWAFTWTPAELTAALGAEAPLVMDWHGVTAQGNFEGRNILTAWRAPAEVAGRHGLTPAALAARIDAAHSALYAARAKRPPPLLDDKVITAWNGLMIGAFAFAGQALGEPRYVAVAARAADFALAHLRGPDGRLHRAWRRGTTSGVATLDDYAALTGGLLDLFEATGEGRWLTAAVALQAALDAHHADPAGGYFATADDGEALLMRDKPDHDGARPAGNSVAALNLLRLAELTGEARYDQTAERLLGAFASRLTRGGTGLPALLAALDYAHDAPREVVVVGTAQDDGAALWAVVGRHFLPNRALVRRAGPGQSPVPWANGKPAQGGRATAYVCEAGRCERPTSDPAVLATQLARVKPLLPDRAPAPLAP